MSRLLHYNSALSNNHSDAHKTLCVQFDMFILILNSASLENYLKEFSHDKISWIRHRDCFIFPKNFSFWAQNALFYFPNERHMKNYEHY